MDMFTFIEVLCTVTYLLGCLLTKKRCTTFGSAIDRYSDVVLSYTLRNRNLCGVICN